MSHRGDIENNDSTEIECPPPRIRMSILSASHARSPFESLFSRTPLQDLKKLNRFLPLYFAMLPRPPPVPVSAACAPLPRGPRAHAVCASAQPSVSYPSVPCTRKYGQHIAGGSATAWCLVLYIHAEEET
jgi:hypothetical protein